MSKQTSQSQWRIVARQFRKRKGAMFTLLLLILLGLVAIFAPFLAGNRPIYVHIDGKTYWFANYINYKDLVTVDFQSWEPGPGDRIVRPPVPYSPEQSQLLERLKGPSEEHWLGTDDRGRDVLSRLIHGTRISMSVGFVAMGIAVFLGVIFGTLAGYYGRWVDVIVLRLIEIFMCFPVLMAIFTLAAILPQSIYTIMIIIGLFGWPDVARFVRGEFLKLRETEYAIAARATGLRDTRIMLRHLLPNALAPVWVTATFGVAGAILMESALSFLGLGVPPPTPSWGETLSQSRSHIHFAWWLVTFPGIAIFVTVTAFNMVGQGLRDAMDPRLRE